MNMEKQIMDMEIALHEAQHEFDKAWTECFHNNGKQPRRENVFYAEYLVNAKGYRKASDVAREILAEIGKRFETLLEFYPCNGEFEDAKSFLDYHWKYIKRSIMRGYDAEFEKKYTEEGK